MKHPIDELVQRLYGMSDDQLLQAFKEAEAETEAAALKHAGFLMSFIRTMIRFQRVI